MSARRNRNLPLDYRLLLLLPSLMQYASRLSLTLAAAHSRHAQHASIFGYVMFCFASLSYFPSTLYGNRRLEYGERCNDPCSGSVVLIILLLVLFLPNSSSSPSLRLSGQAVNWRGKLADCFPVNARFLSYTRQSCPYRRKSSLCSCFTLSSLKDPAES